MGVAADARDPLQAEVERFRLKAGFFKEGDEERAKAAVHVQAELLPQRKPGEAGDVVDDAVGEVGRRPNEQDCVAVD